MASLLLLALPFAASVEAQTASSTSSTGTASTSSASTQPIVRFGMDAASLSYQKEAGVAANYGSLWIGPWTLKSGWGGPDGQLDRLRAAGVTPAIHLYYWGDDISRSCVENGCWSSMHGTQKDRERWSQLSQQLIAHLNAHMEGKTVVVFLETEFNKGDVEEYEPLDAYLAAKAYGLRKGYPAAKVVLGLGNWDSGSWDTWDRAATASDYVGLQGMRASTRDSSTSYDTLYAATLAGVRKAHALFGKPVFLHDIALSSYPDGTYAQRQADALHDFFAGMADLRAAGVRALMYRSWLDTPTMDTDNYYGEAERHWGLATSSAEKPAADVWVQGVLAERARASFSATFKPDASSNEWWVEAAVSSASRVAKVEARVDGGAWSALAKTDWGTWAKSLHAPKGHAVEFRATDDAGRTVVSPVFSWLTSSFSASFTPKAQGNDWWVESAVKSSASVAKVEARLDGGSWTSLPRTDWGTWGKSLYAPYATKVEFRATSTSGATARSVAYTW